MVKTPIEKRLPQDNQQTGETTAKERARTEPRFQTCEWHRYLA